MSQDLSATLISAWRKEELRNKLKALKKSVDDMDRNRKARLVQNVSMCIYGHVYCMDVCVCMCACVCIHVVSCVACISVCMHVPSCFLV